MDNLDVILKQIGEYKVLSPLWWEGKTKLEGYRMAIEDFENEISR